MLSRRRFLFMLGGGATGVWLASTGLIRLERRFVLALGGQCSFCGKAHREVRTLLGTFDRAVQVCDECVDLCVQIIAEETAEQPRPPTQPPPPPRIVVDDPGDAELVERLRRLAEEHNAERAEALLADARRAFERHPTRFLEFHCSFCDAPRREVRKLISGSRVFICDGCVADSAAVVSHVLRA